MRRAAPPCVSILMLAGLTLALFGPAPAIAQSERRPVNVHVTCPNDLAKGALVVQVNPWIIEVRPQDTIRWNLTTNNSANNAIKVQKKRDQNWPFPVDDYQGGGGADSGNLTEGAEGTYPYDILVYCGSDEPILIDPRIRVGGG